MKKFFLVIGTVYTFLYFWKITDYVDVYIGESTIKDFVLWLISILFIQIIYFIVKEKSFRSGFNRHRFQFVILYILFLLMAFFGKDISYEGATLVNFDLFPLEANMNSNERIFGVIANIVILIPSGVMLHRYKLGFLYMLVVIFAVETLQYILRVGIFDVQDIFFNMIGFCLGVFLIKVFLLMTGEYSRKK
ncbi:MAG: VanZ family protein [Mycoplasmatales bacterium]